MKKNVSSAKFKDAIYQQDLTDIELKSYTQNTLQSSETLTPHLTDAFQSPHHNYPKQKHHPRQNQHLNISPQMDDLGENRVNFTII